MSSISPISSVTSAYQPNAQNSIGNRYQDFAAIGGALQAGDLTSAQAALALFQQGLQSASPSTSTQPFGNNGQANTAYHNLVSALGASNLSGAQSAFASLQSALKPVSVHPGGHHHHGAGAAPLTGIASTLTPSATVSGSSAAGLNVTA